MLLLINKFELFNVDFIVIVIKLGEFLNFKVGEIEWIILNVSVEGILF